MLKPILILQAQGGAGGSDEYLIIDKSPFTVGRHKDNDAAFPTVNEISGKHARFEFADGSWSVTDLKSTNKTYVNGKQLEHDVRTPLAVGDFVALAKQLYRVVPKTERPGGAEVVVRTMGLQDTWELQNAPELIRILEQQRTYPFFQPIVDLQSQETLGWEALGRAVGTAGPIPIGKLFNLAAYQRRETDLSLAFRESSRQCAECRHCWTNQTPFYLFFNLHPAEIYEEQRFLQSVRVMSESAELRKWYKLVVEMPESWVSKVDQMRRVVDKIRELGMLVAYDDFGQGQSRLEEMVRIPPDFLKLDRHLIADLGGARTMYRISQALVETCRELKVVTLGEGIETQEEWQACKDLQMDLGQGYLFETPKAAYQLFKADPATLPVQRPDCPFVKLNLIKR